MNAIAQILGRAPSSISREIRRNSTKRGYDAHTAQQRYHQQRVECRLARKLAHRPIATHHSAKLVDTIGEIEVLHQLVRHSRLDQDTVQASLQIAGAIFRADNDTCRKHGVLRVFYFRMGWFSTVKSLELPLSYLFSISYKARTEAKRSLVPRTRIERVSNP